MKLFNFGEDNAPQNASDTGAAGASAAPSEGSVSAATRAAAAENAQRALGNSPRKRRPRGDAGTSGPSNSEIDARINAAIKEQLEIVHAPEQWAALLSMPADAALAYTGNKRWEIASEERKTLGMTGSAAARTMMITNPKALAFMMLGAALFSVYVPRATAQLKEMRDEQERKKKAAQAGGGNGA